MEARLEATASAPPALDDQRSARLPVPPVEPSPVVALPARLVPPAVSEVWMAGETRAPEEIDAAPAENGAEPPNSDPDATNVWPDATAEAAFLAEARGRGEPATRVDGAADEEPENTGQPLPPLEELVNRVPAATRELIDDLFRARFVAVRRVKKSDLKTAAEA